MIILFILIYIAKLSYCTLILKNLGNNAIIGRFFDVESLFGSDFDEGTEGYLIESYPILACNDTIDSPPYNWKNLTNIIFVSLIRRGNCTFEHKVRAAQNSGYYGVIIYNNNSDSIFPMPKPRYSTDDPVHIPSRMVGRTSGYRLRNYTYTSIRTNYIVIFHKDFEFDPRCYIIAFLAFVSIGFLIIGLVFAFKLCRNFVKSRANRLKKSHLKHIPIKKFVKAEDQFETCAICLDDFCDGDKLRILLCNHAYHVKCIDTWLLTQKRNCPVCKCRVKIPGKVEESDDNVSIVTASENATSASVDEHTPLINNRDGSGSQFYFGNNEITENNSQPLGHSKSLTQNSYENPCIDCGIGDGDVNPPSATAPTDTITLHMPPAGTRLSEVLVTSHLNDGAHGTALKTYDDLTKMV